MNVKIVNYETGNLSSVVAALGNLGITSSIVSHCSECTVGDVIILPGVGSFDRAAGYLKAGGFYDYDFSANKNTVIGICLGFHLMCMGSDEGSSPGLGLFNSRVIDFKRRTSPILHLGWSEVQSGVPSFSGRHYFCHRYFIENGSGSAAYLDRDGQSVCNVLNKGSFWGVQSHPERSGSAGLRLLNELIFYES